MARVRDAVGAAEQRLRRRSGRFWLLLSRGVLAVLFGATALFWPRQAPGFLVLLIGCYLVLDGLLGFVQALGSSDFVASLMQPMASVAAGATALLWSEISGALLLAVLGVWALLQGGGLIHTGRRVRSKGEGGELFLTVGGALVLFGVVALVWRDTSAVALTWLGGMVALAVGVLLALGARHLKRVERTREPVAPPEE